MNTVLNMQAALAGAITVRTWWSCPGFSGEAFRSRFLDCLMAKIHRHDRRHGRRLTPDYQASLYRDFRRPREIRRRIIHRQFETDIFQRRFGHLLTHD